MMTGPGGLILCAYSTGQCVPIPSTLGILEELSDNKESGLKDSETPIMRRLFLLDLFSKSSILSCRNCKASSCVCTSFAVCWNSSLGKKLSVLFPVCSVTVLQVSCGAGQYLGKQQIPPLRLWWVWWLQLLLQQCGHRLDQQILQELQPSIVCPSQMGALLCMSAIAVSVGCFGGSDWPVRVWEWGWLSGMSAVG